MSLSNLLLSVYFPFSSATLVLGIIPSRAVFLVKGIVGAGAALFGFDFFRCHFQIQWIELQLSKLTQEDSK